MDEYRRKVRIIASKTAIRSMKIMVSPSVSKVNNPPHLAVSLPVAIVRRWKPLLLLEGVLAPGHCTRCVCQGATRDHWA
jgi:flagellar biosynthesis protein FlhB